MSDNTGWLPPSSGGEQAASQPAASPPVPRYGAYGTPPAGQPAGQAGGAWTPGAYGTPAPQAPSAPQGAWGRFVLAPKPGIIPLRPLGVTEIISGAVDSLRANPRAMFVPALVVMSVIGFVSALLEGIVIHSLGSVSTSLSTDVADASLSAALAPSLASVGASLAQVVLTMIASAVLTGLLIVTVSRSVLGRVASLGDVWERTKGRVWALVGQTLLISLVTTVVAGLLIVVGVLLIVAIMSAAPEGSGTGVVLAVLAGVVIALVTAVCCLFLWVRLSLSSAALVLENIGVMDGIRRSWRLTQGSFWRILGVLLLAALIQSALSALLTGSVSVVTLVVGMAGPTHTALASALVTFLSSVVNALVLPFSAAVVALTYIDLRMRHEGLDVELRHAAAR